MICTINDIRGFAYEIAIGQDKFTLANDEWYISDWYYIVENTTVGILIRVLNFGSHPEVLIPNISLSESELIKLKHILNALNFALIKGAKGTVYCSCGELSNMLSRLSRSELQSLMIQKLPKNINFAT